MNEQPDLLVERFAALTNPLDDSDWLDVRRRARTVSRRWLLLPLAATVAVIAVGSAFALYRDLVDFGSAQPAPERVQLDFDSLRERAAAVRAKTGSPPITPEGPAREVMRVQLDGEATPLSVVPTREGSFCYRLAFAVSCPHPDAKQPNGIGYSGLATPDGSGSQWLAGPVLDDAVQTVELLYQDGDKVRLPFVWVSPPIDAGFYAYDVPERHEQPGHLSAVLIGRDGDGNPVAHLCLIRSADELAHTTPEAAAFCDRRA
jgi:hypothetical protein